MRPTFAGRFAERRLRLDGTLVVSSCLLLAGCANLPDTRPFTDATINLRSAVASSGTTVVSELERTPIEGVRREAKALEDAWKERNRLFGALVDYADSLQSIVESGAGKAGTINALSAAARKLAQAAAIVEPSAGDAGSSLGEAAVFIYKQIAKAQAAASLERALSEIQPAIERIALIMSDQMQAMDGLIRAACQAQRDELRIANQTLLGYRCSVSASREKLMDQIRTELDSGKKPSAISQTEELARLDGLFAATDSRNDLLQSELRAITEKERLSRLLIAETRSALAEWAAIHGRILTAIHARRMLVAVELGQAAERIRALVEKFVSL